MPNARADFELLVCLPPIARLPTPGHDQTSVVPCGRSQLGQKHKQVDFRQHGIRILSYASAKGLEFDTVFLPELDTRVTDPDSDFEKMRFYVLCSRAREELFLLAKGNSPPPLLHRVPRLLLTVEHIE